MAKNPRETNIEIIETTVGDLVEAITQIAIEAGKTEEEGYRLASLTVENILNRQYQPENRIN